MILLFLGFECHLKNIQTPGMKSTLEFLTRDVHETHKMYSLLLAFAFGCAKSCLYC